MARAKGALVTPVPGTQPRAGDSSWRRTWGRWGQAGEVTWQLNSTTGTAGSIPTPQPCTLGTLQSQGSEPTLPCHGTAQNEFPCSGALNSAQQLTLSSSSDSSTCQLTHKALAGEVPREVKDSPAVNSLFREGKGSSGPLLSILRDAPCLQHTPDGSSSTEYPLGLFQV